MESINPLPPTVQILMAGTAACDESKCVSRALSDLHDGSFTCYGDDGAFYPRMCANGFLPVVVNNEPSREITKKDRYGTVKAVTLSYYTCCPPEEEHYTTPDSILSQNMIANRRCSDPIVVTHDSDSDTDKNATCDNEGLRKHLFPMKTNVVSQNSIVWAVKATDSFLCCDNDDNLNDIDFLGDTDCVPYRSKFYEDYRAINTPGLFRPITCDFPEGSFRFARPLDGDAPDAVVASGRYQCCKSGDALPPFVQDSTFRNFVYPSLVFHVFSILVTLLVAVALLVPLLVERCNGTDNKNQRGSLGRREGGSSLLQQEDVKSTSMKWSDSSMRWWSSTDTRSSRSSRLSTARGRKTPYYNTYNLYVCFLLFTDVAYLLFQIVVLGSYANQKYLFWGQWIRKSDLIYGYLSWDKAFVGSYMFTNLLINAVIAYEILALLQASNKMRRIKPPSLTRVNLQLAAGVFGFVNEAIVTCIIVYLTEKFINSGNNGAIQILDIIFMISFNAFFGVPIAYVTYVTILIWWKEYIPSKNGSFKDKAVRELIFFFGRIIGVFMFIWSPVLGLYIYAHMTSSGWAYVIVKVLTGLQPLLTVAAALTKTDSRKYVDDFWKSLTSCFARSEEETSQHPVKNTSVEANAGSGAPMASGISTNNSNLDPENGDNEGDSNLFSPSANNSLGIYNNGSTESSSTGIAEIDPEMDGDDGDVPDSNASSNADEISKASSADADSAAGFDGNDGVVQEIATE